MSVQSAPGTGQWFAEELRRARLLAPEQAAALRADVLHGQSGISARQLADTLVRRRLLSRFQAETALAGDAGSLDLGTYSLIEPLQASPLGTSYRALNLINRVEYTVGVLSPRSRWNLRRAGHQVRAFGEMPPHPAVVPCVDVGIVHERHYLAWPLLDGESLANLVNRRGPLDPRAVACLGLRLAEGLAECHDRGLIHGLVKPSSIQIDSSGSPRMLDFGIGAILADNTDAGLIDDLSQAACVPDLFDCSSPECIVDPTNRSAAGDQYGLGCALYFALTGQSPFSGGSLLERMVAHHLQPLSLRRLDRSVPSGLQEILRRMMAKSPADRFRDRADLLRELERLAGGTKIELPGEAPGDDEEADTAIFGFAADTQTRLPAPPAAPPPPAPPKPVIEPLSKSRLGRAVERLAFWRPVRDELAVTVFAPVALPAGEPSEIALAVHAAGHDDAAIEAHAQLQPHRLIASIPLRRSVAAGSDLAVHLALPGIPVDPPDRHVAWQGRPEFITFRADVPDDCRPGELVGVVSIAAEHDTIMHAEFRVSVGPC